MRGGLFAAFDHKQVTGDFFGRSRAEGDDFGFDP
jgi:hypothetical protein